MQINAALLDFDGTFTTEDMLNIICGIIGKQKESEEATQLFHDGKMEGIDCLMERLELIKGLYLQDIIDELEKNDYLRKGGQELIEVFKKNEIKTILCSGHLVPILEHYQKKIGVDYVVGTKADVIDNKLVKIHRPDPDFKVQGAKKILSELGISQEKVIAYGDSPADRFIFDYAALAVAVDPKGDIADHPNVKYSVKKDLRDSIPFLEKQIRSI